MYLLLVKSGGWKPGSDVIESVRAFEHTEDHLVEQFTTDGAPNGDLLASIPALIMSESDQRTVPPARVGSVSGIKKNGRWIEFSHAHDPQIPPIPNEVLKELASELHIEDWECHRTHWAVKDVDLCRVLMRHTPPRRKSPSLFQIADPEEIEDDLVSVMMPFDQSFDAVYDSITNAAKAADMRCLRADDIWEHQTVIQDVVSLIDRSRVVVCDVTNRNPNVFYETGIAHSLDRATVVIAQTAEDVPFDLRHHRYLQYLNNGEGLEKLASDLAERLRTLRSQARK